MPITNPYLKNLARPRAEAASAPLEDVREAARADKSYLYGLAVIVADLIKPAEVTEPDNPSEPDAPQPNARTRRAWSGVMERINGR